MGWRRLAILCVNFVSLGGKRSGWGVVDVEFAWVKIKVGVIECAAWLASMGNQWTAGGAMTVGLGFAAPRWLLQEERCDASLVAACCHDVSGESTLLNDVVGADVGGRVVCRAICRIIGVERNRNALVK